MAKLFLDLSKVKKMASDKDTTTFKHEDGHEIKVAHNALTPKMRSQLASLPEIAKEKAKETKRQLKEKAPELKMAEGGQTPKPSPSKGPYIDPNKAKQIEDSANESGWQPGRWKKNLKEGLGLAKGGQIESGAAASGFEAPHMEGNNKAIERLDQRTAYADGGIASQKELYSDENNPKLAQSKKEPVERKLFASGGESEDQKPITINVGQPPQIPNNPDLINPNPGSGSNSSNPRQMSPEQVAASGQQVPGMMEKIGNAILPTQSQGYQSSAPQMPPVDTAPDAPSQPVQPIQEESQTPDPLLQAQEQAANTMAGAAGEQIAGIAGEAAARGKMGKQQADAEAKHIEDQQSNAANYQDQFKRLQDERDNLLHDFQNEHIDPEHYMANRSTGQKVSSAIGLILGGIGAGLTGGPNPAMEMLKLHINNDIEAQKANLGKKQSLLSENLKQFGNLRDATDMTRLMSGDIVAHQLQMAAQKAQSPIEASRAMQAIAQIKAGLAPVQQQLAMRQALMSSQQSGKSKMDPAMLIPQMVPKEHQKEAYKEIQVAQNTHHMAKNIMEAFEQAAKDVTGMGRITSHIKDPRSIGALHQHMQPTFADLEGTVRQAAMDNTFHNITPSPYDTEADIQTKRKALQEYMQSKMSAPIAKSSGIDLSKFESTNAKPKMSAQEQKFLDFAKKNPNDPRSALILKKLGVE